MAILSCSVPDCDKTGRTIRGWCENHYFSWRKYGDPLQAKRNKQARAQTATVCAVEGCEDKPRRTDLCGRHHHRKLKYGDPLGAPTPPPVRLCSVDGCENTHRCNGFCSKHYARLRATGDPLGSVTRKPRAERFCEVPECSEKHYMYGYCGRHSYSLKQYGSPTSIDHKAAEREALIQLKKRTCSDCGETLSAENFTANPNNKADGLYSICKECVSQKAKRRYVKNRETYLAKGAEWRANNPGKAREKYLANKDYYLEGAKRRKAKLRGDGSERGITVNALRHMHGDNCCYCGVGMVFNTEAGYDPIKATLEHLLPLSRGGTHTFANCRLACYSCNLAKNAKTLDEWSPPSRTKRSMGGQLALLPHDFTLSI